MRPHATTIPPLGLDRTIYLSNLQLEKSSYIKYRRKRILKTEEIRGATSQGRALSYYFYQSFIHHYNEQRSPNPASGLSHMQLCHEGEFACSPTLRMDYVAHKMKKKLAFRLAWRSWFLHVRDEGFYGVEQHCFLCPTDSYFDSN